jgi:hypothetical protein
MNTSKNLQIVWSQFFINKLIFVNIWVKLNIYWFIRIRINCQRIQMNSFLVTFDYLLYLVSYLIINNKGYFKHFAVTYNRLHIVLHDLWPLTFCWFQAKILARLAAESTTSRTPDAARAAGGFRGSNSELSWSPTTSKSSSSREQCYKTLRGIIYKLQNH